MSFTVEQWAKDWLAEQRRNGERCLEVKVSNGKHYVYRSTTRYDRETKRPKKVSEYIGTLDREKGFTPRRKKRAERETCRTIKVSGTMRVLDSLGGDVAAALEHRFGDLWQRIYATALLMAVSPVRMRGAADRWDRYERVRGLEPAMSEGSLKEMYAAVGDDREAQNLFFQDMMGDVREIAFDLSEFFSASGELSLAEGGRNPEHDDRKQINIALSCDMTTGEPLYSRALQGSVRDVKALVASVKEMRHKEVVLVGDRGFYSEHNLEFIRSQGMHFAVPVKRNSDYYEQVAVSATDAFRWRDRVIRYGKRSLTNGNWLYRFENLEMACSEEQNALLKVMDGSMDREAYLAARPRMGHMVVVSDLDREPERIYELYKRRDCVEKGFRRFFETLGADSLGVSDDATARGMVFVLTLAVRLRTRLKNLIARKDLSSHLSVDDVLDAYSRAYAAETESGYVDYEYPARLEKLDSDLGLNIFPISRRLCVTTPFRRFFPTDPVDVCCVILYSPVHPSNLV